MAKGVYGKYVRDVAESSAVMRSFIKPLHHTRHNHIKLREGSQDGC